MKFISPYKGKKATFYVPAGGENIAIAKFDISRWDGHFTFYPPKIVL